MHSPGCHVDTLQSLISSRGPPLCLDSIVMTSCFNFLDPHTVFRNVFSSLSQSFDCFQACRSKSRPSFSIAAMDPCEFDLSALPWASIRAPSFFFAFIVEIWVSNSLICFLHSLRVVDNRNSTCCFSDSNSATIISNLSRNRLQFGLLATVQKNFALCLLLLFCGFWNGNVTFVKFGAFSSDNSFAAWANSFSEIHPFGGASSSLMSRSVAVFSP
mmetsp:Transcript_20990/g.51513  ORF Transcript_20990/g.51513 Transcript_20990/m.51513 type:complete len:215 (-) Transcript_20990:1265-1909(-)